MINVFFFLFLDERSNRVLLLSSKNKKKKTLMNPWFRMRTCAIFTGLLVFVYDLEFHYRYLQRRLRLETS